MIQSRFLALVAAFAVVGAACVPPAGAPTWTYTPGGQGGSGGGAAPAPTQGGGAGGEVLGSLVVKAVDLGFEPKELSVEKAGVYEVKLDNAGALPHDITFADGTTGLAKPGGSVTVTVNVPDGGITFICSIPGHSDAGMTGVITVAGSTVP